MLKDSHAFSGFSVKNLDETKRFYNQTLGIDVDQDQMGLTLKIAGGNDIFVYQKDDHAPATYTILNFEVEDIDKTVDELTGNGVVFEQYGEMTDKKGIARGVQSNRGPDIAWFKDPSGNILSVLNDGR